MEIAQNESSDDDFQHQNLGSINKGLTLIGESPVVKSKLLPGGQYPKIKSKLLFINQYLEIGLTMMMMVKQLKIKFHETDEKSVKIQILTLYFQ